MTPMPQPWDYLIVTASNEAQAAAYERQLQVRKDLGLLSGLRKVMVIPDREGKRIGSGGSTLLCLMEILNRRLAGRPQDAADRQAWQSELAALRILIIHAGGDSRRLPAYGPCGKVFVPVPGEGDTALPATLFDRQLPAYLALPPMPEGAGQVVIASGDVLLLFDPHDVQFAPRGMTGLGCHATPEEASGHGVYCPTADGLVRLFLQKPTVAEQAAHDAINRYGQTVLDIGVVNFDAATACTLLAMCDVRPDAAGRLDWHGEMGRAVEALGLDFYREICCAMGTEASSTHLSACARSSGSRWPDALLGRIFQTLSATPFAARVLARCGFLHFGTTRQVIASGADLLRRDLGVGTPDGLIDVNNEVGPEGRLVGANAWVEGCRIRGRLELGGWNLAVGLEVDGALQLPPRACLDVSAGQDREGQPIWFLRCYGVDDTFKDPADEGATFCGMDLRQWLAAVEASEADVWDAQLPPPQRMLWNAQIFPAGRSPSEYRRWLWMFDPASASAEQHKAWKDADRYSAAEAAELTDQQAFHESRAAIRAEQVRRALPCMFRLDSGFSAAELAYALPRAAHPADWFAQLVEEARGRLGDDGGAARLETLTSARILHTMGSAILQLAGRQGVPLEHLIPAVHTTLPPAAQAWLDSMDLGIRPGTDAATWADHARSAAFRLLGRTILRSAARRGELPKCVLRGDEIVWGRAPARLDLGGGWTDTPPYCLEWGGCVLNAAVNLNGQPPIHVYIRRIAEPVIRIASIDLGLRIEVADLEGLLGYRVATGEFALAKAALALSAFSPEAAPWPEGATLAAMLQQFGGGLELTTLAAIPKGSGLGTSSIVGAVLLASIQRTLGRTLSRQELFHGVLQLEQALTTGGGWQDQVGGAVEGVKLIQTDPGLIPDPRIHYVPPDVLDPRANGGATLLYYTGLTRLAKNLLQQVVGRYLDRDRAGMETLRQLHALGPRVAEAMARKDLPAFGVLIDAAWRLNKQLDPNSSTLQIEELLASIAPHIWGAKLLGAGGGGFLLMVCKSPDDARAVRAALEGRPANDRARFFDFDISREGLVVTVS